MKLSIAQRLYLGLATGYIIVAIVGILSYVSYQKQIRQARWVQLTQEIIHTSTSIKQLVIQLEVAKRNLFVTGNPHFNHTFDTTERSLRNTLTHLSVLVPDNSTPRSHVDRIERSVEDVLQYWQNVKFAGASDSVAFRKIIHNSTELITTFNQEIESFEQYENELLVQRNDLNERSSQQAIATLLFGLALILIIVTILSYQVYRELTSRVRSQMDLKQNLQEMEALNAETSQRNWQLSSLSTINNLLQGKYYEDASKLANACTQALAELLQIPSATLYHYVEDAKLLVPIGKFAAPSGAPPHHRLGEGITGQAAVSREITVLNNLAESNLTLQTGIGPIQPKSLVLVPLWADDQLIGLLELIGITEFTHLQLQLLDLLTHNMAGALQSVTTREHLEELVSQISKQKEELEATQETLTEQATALEQSNRYKSEFLANMSHELRTPLNSILILANLLAEDKEGRLTEKQKEYSHIIHKSGSDLLHLINDILDLSKIEAGKIDLFPEEVAISSLLSDMKDLFTPIAEERQIQLKIVNKLEQGLVIFTDKKRVEQILKNLLSNALKFTPAGGEVTCTAEQAKEKDQLAFVVKDNGMGIAEEYQTAIFEAFQQADGATNRQYGGTGLGLSISKNLARRLGGTITLSSALGEGSEFTLLLPKIATPSSRASIVEIPPPSAPFSADMTELPSITQQIVHDDRNVITPGDTVLLIIEDDENFATILRDFARRKKYLTIVALTGEEGLHCAQKYKPSAILLDIQLPGLSGTEVLSTLKRKPGLTNIPVHIITSHDDLGHLSEKVSGITVKPFELEELDTIFKTFAKQGPSETLSPKVKPAPASVETPISSPTPTDTVSDIRLDGFKILLTDDDMRNVYSLSALLEIYGAEIITASNGQEALEQLSENEGIQLVLMDIMMPVMDGYETIREIRKNPQWDNIPIVAISAKAMPGDRQKALEVGACDYLTKPIDRNLLITLVHKCLTATS